MLFFSQLAINAYFEQKAELEVGVCDTPGPEDQGETTLLGCSASALPFVETGKPKAGNPGQHGPILDDGVVAAIVCPLWWHIISGRQKTCRDSPS